MSNLTISSIHAVYNKNYKGVSEHACVIDAKNEDRYVYTH